MKNATKVRETNLNWEWATGCGTAAYCAWYVGEPAPAPDGTDIVAGVKDAANQLQLYLDYAAKTGGRPDFSKPPVSDLFVAGSSRTGTPTHGSPRRFCAPSPTGPSEDGSQGSKGAE